MWDERTECPHSSYYCNPAMRKQPTDADDGTIVFDGLGGSREGVDYQLGWIAKVLDDG